MHTTSSPTLNAHISALRIALRIHPPPLPAPQLCLHRPISGQPGGSPPAPVYLRLRELILTSGKVVIDETTAPVLDPGRGRTKQGYFWAVARDDRPWAGTDPPAIVFTYAPGRGAIYGLKLLDGYRGIVQCDGYEAYKSIAAKTPGDAITLAFCWTHLRRRFYDIAKGGDAPIASEALERIAALYAIEKTIRGMSADDRRRLRQEKSKSLVASLKSWFEYQLARVSTKSTIADEIRYGLNHCSSARLNSARASGN